MHKEEKPLTIQELRKLRPPLRNFYIAQKERLSGSQRFATWVTERVGTMGFFYILILWTILWLGWNTIAPLSMRFDPYPAFVIWLFISNVIQLILLPIIMLGQNLQGVHSEARAQADFELNQIAEKEVETILMHLENQNDVMLTILRELEEKKK